MAYIVLVINAPNNSIDDLNNRCQNPGNLNDPINKCGNLLHAIAGGKITAAVQVTTRDSDPSVSTSGADSQQNTYDKR